MRSPVKTLRTRALPALTVALLWSLPAAAQQNENADDDLAPDAEAAAPASDKAKLLVLPFQPIYRTVEQDKAEKATDFLNRALSADLQVIRGGEADNSAQAPSLAAAEAAKKAAEAAEANRDLAEAITQRKAVLKAMEENASALDNADQYVIAQHYLARALMWAAADGEAKAILAEAARMNPSMELPATEFSRLYRKWFVDIAKKVVEEKPGDLLVKSALPGAVISLDGREMDVAPVLLQKAVPGKHLIAALVAGVPPYKAIVEVKSGAKSEYRVIFGGTKGGPAVGEVTDAISTNAMSKDAVTAAVNAGKAAGADYVVAGGMSKGEDHFKMHTFVVDVKSGKLQPLDMVKFDLDLLTAEADVIRIARQVETAVKSFSAPKPMIAAIDATVRSTTTITEVSAAPDTSGLTGPAKAQKAKKDGPRRVIGAVKEGKVKIKDD
jgi:TolB-like protein